MTDSTTEGNNQTSLIFTEAREAFERARVEAGTDAKVVLDDRKALRHFHDWCRDVRTDPLNDLTSLTREDLNQFKAWVSQSREINTAPTIAYVREFVNWLEEQDYIDQDLHSVLEGD